MRMKASHHQHSKQIEKQENEQAKEQISSFVTAYVACFRYEQSMACQMTSSKQQAKEKKISVHSTKRKCTGNLSAQ